MILVITPIMYFTKLKVFCFGILVVTLIISFINFIPRYSNISRGDNKSYKSYYHQLSVETSVPEIPHSEPVIPKNVFFRNGTFAAPAVYLRLKGGLGNQLFQYACHYALAKKNNWPLLIQLNRQTTDLETRNFQPYSREYSLDSFNIPVFNWVTDQDIRKTNKITYVTDSQLLSEAYPQDRILSLSGGDYCQSEAFFSPYKKEIVELFSQKISDNVDQTFQNWINLIDSRRDSIAIHIRRGDFLNINTSLPISYYDTAMRRMSNLLRNISVQMLSFTSFTSTRSPTVSRIVSLENII